MDKDIKDGILEEEESFGGTFFVLIQKHSKLLFKQVNLRFYSVF